jgi:rhamnogalacturonyl hydrolase YesR
MQRRDWEQGILAQAFLETGDNDNLIRLTKAAIVQRTADGRLAVVVSGGPTDPAMGGEAYWKAGQLTGDREIQDAVRGMLDYLLQKAPRAADGTLYHVFQAPQVWSDGFNGAPPFLAAMGRYDEARAQIEGFRKRLWNPEKKLLSNIWDDGTQKFKRQDFWGTGQGWAAAGLARVIRSLPADRGNDRQWLAAFARDILDGCLAWQRPDGLFHDVVDRPDTFVETNLAQMLAYAIYTGVAGGWLDRSYLAKAGAMRRAARDKMDRYGFVHGVCGAPRFDRAGLSTEGQSFFLMMEAAGNRV